MSEQNKNNSGASPITEMVVALTGASHNDGHGSPVGPPTDAVLQKGHEPDNFGIKGILLVPVAVVIMAGLAYLVVSLTFNAWFRDPSKTTSGNALAVKNDGPVNDRFAKISSTDENAEVKAPRLEYLKKSDSVRGGKADPEYMRSVRFTEKGNSPEYYPEDLRADNFIDPITRQKILKDYAWVVENKVIRMPVAKAMEILVKTKQLPAVKDSKRPASTTAEEPKLSNGGQGNLTPVVAKKPDTTHDHKDDHKDEKKK